MKISLRSLRAAVAAASKEMIKAFDIEEGGSGFLAVTIASIYLASGIPGNEGFMKHKNLKCDVMACWKKKRLIPWLHKPDGYSPRIGGIFVYPFSWQTVQLRKVPKVFWRKVAKADPEGKYSKENNVFIISAISNLFKTAI